ncbi:hypothetical protein J6X73_01530 [Candidatus Saccharibacteria bacterium]|nr:hypothetical protein [Candidatus Saccharibacteria bacterium]
MPTSIVIIILLAIAALIVLAAIAKLTGSGGFIHESGDASDHFRSSERLMRTFRINGKDVEVDCNVAVDSGSPIQSGGVSISDLGINIEDALRESVSRNSQYFCKDIFDMRMDSFMRRLNMLADGERFTLDITVDINGRKYKYEYR